MAILLYVYLAYVLVQTHGNFSVSGVIQTSVVVVLFCVWCLAGRPDLLHELAPKTESRLRRALAPDLVLAALVASFCLSLVWRHHLNGRVSAEWIHALRVLLAAAAVLAYARLMVAVFAPARWERLAVWLEAGTGILLIVAQLATIRATPRPFIDVFTITRDALDYLSRGSNPYAQAYEDIYHGKYGYPAGANYWPGLFWPLLPFHALFGDFRVAYVVGNLLTALAIRRLGSRLGALAWLSFPVTYFVLEYAWVDSLLLPFVAWGAVALRGGRWLPAGLLIGYACATKQHGVVIAWSALIWIAASAGRTAAIRFTLAAAGTVLFLLLPFVLADWPSFYSSAIEIFLRQPLRADAHSIPALVVAHYNWVFPAAVRLVIVASVAGVLIPVWLWRRGAAGPQSLSCWAAAITMTYGVIFLISQNAFCNYYYFLAFFPLLDLVHDRSRSPGNVVASSAPLVTCAQASGG